VTQFISLTSKLVPLLLANVDTDQIIPAQYVNAVGEQALASALFSRRKAEDPDFVFNRPEMKGRSIMLAGPNFGCGSSREAAAWALKAGGIRALVGTSFNQTFATNCAQNGMPTVRLDPVAFGQVVALLDKNPDLELTIDLRQGSVTVDGHALTFPTGIDPFISDLMVRSIDELAYLLERRPLIAAFEAAHRDV